MNIGIGVMIQHLGGNADPLAAYKASVGETISSITVAEDADDGVRINLDNGTTLVVSDQGQSCCESRYMRTDDDLEWFAGATLNSIELKDAPDEPDEYGTHEVQFLEVNTSKGAFTVASHNEHNGYYGGFYICFKLEVGQ